MSVFFYNFTSIRFQLNKMRNRNYLSLIAVVLILGLISSCNNNDPENARLQVVLIDAPAEYDGVLVDVEGVSANFNQSDDAEESDGGWTVITSSEFEPGQIDLLELVNGTEAMLADESIPAGKLNEIRLHLSDDNILVIGEEEKALTVPSGSASGLKIKLDAELKAGITYKLILDFDAARSVVATGSGKYNLKPVIHANMEAQTGAISGTVSGLDSGVGVVLYAVQGIDSVSTYPNESGEFLIQALEAGTYDVEAVPDSETQKITVEDVNVTVGDVSDTGDISFAQ